MKLSYEPIECRVRRTFRISQEAHDSYHMVIARLEHGGVVGYGEAAPSTRVTSETIETVQQVLAWAAKEVEDVRPENWEGFLDRLHADERRGPSARAAVDLAVHDLVGRLEGVPARRLYGLQDGRLETCMTVSLDEPEVMADEARGYHESGFRVLKLKLGDAARDAQRVEAVRRAVPGATLRADANTGWTMDEARAVLPRLAELGVEFCEQPFRAGEFERMAELSRESPLPLYADESVKDVRDVRRLHEVGFRGGVNLKLQKTGGLRPAVAALREARERGYQVQMGCMVETAVGISAGVQLVGVLDHADLDGHLLLKDRPFDGPMPERGWYVTPDAPGLGVAPAAGAR